jgi:hypothetical protein
MNRRFREVVRDPNERRTQHLNQALHHLYCFTDINQHATNELEQALAIKSKRKKPGKVIRDPDSDQESGGAKWWSPRSIKKERIRLQAEEEEAKLKKLHKTLKTAEQSINKSLLSGTGRSKQQREQ